MNTEKTALALGYAGLIPFAVLAIDPLTTQVIDPFLSRLWLLSYGAVILSFLGGIMWGRAMREPEAGGTLVLSILISLAGWGALLLLGAEAFWLLAVAFVVALVIDLRADLPPWFRRLRIHLSIGAILAMLAGALA
jgi:uncharacterized membrane protein